MGLLRKFQKGIIALTQEMSKPESFSKGEDFELFVRKYTFPSRLYQIVNKTHPYQENKTDYIENSLSPDYTFRCRNIKKDFMVEVKFRKGHYKNDKIEWCNEKQLKRYKSINNIPVFLCLGIGDNAIDPDEVFVIPLSKVNFTGLYDSFLDRYVLDHPRRTVEPKYLHSL